MNKNFKIATSALLSSLLIAGYALPIHAEGEEETTTEETTTEVESSSGVTKNESVYAVLNADGSVKTVTVSDTLHSDSGFDNYSDTTSLSNIENLKSNDEVNVSNGNITWNTDSTDIYYQGSSKEDLPLDVSIKYYLNDSEYKPSEIVGKSGHVKIKIEVTNNSKQSYTVNDKTYDLVTPFITAAGLMMDEDNFSNVEVNHGTVSSDSSHSIVAAVMIPGLREGLESTIDPDVMNKISDYLIDDITIEADTDNFASPTMMLAAATSTDALKDQFEGTDISSIFDQLDQLKDATNQLITGTQSLYDGAVQLNDGVGTLQDGATSLQSGASQVATGASTLAGGLETLNSKSSELTAGSAQLKDGVMTLVKTVLSSQGYDTTNIDWSNYATTLASSSYMGLNQTQIDGAREKVKTAVSTQLSNANISLPTGVTVDNIVDTLIYMSAGSNPTSSDALTQSVTAASEQLLAALTVLNSDAYKNAEKVATEYAENTLFDANGAVQNTSDATYGTVNTAIQNALSAIKTAKGATSYTDKQMFEATLRSINSENMNQSALVFAYAITSNTNNSTDINALLENSAKVLTPAKQAKEALETVIAGSDETKEAIKGVLAAVVAGEANSSFTQLLTLLNGANALDSGINQYTAGVASAATGSATLASGAQQVSDGASKLSSGTDTLKSGSQQLADGAKTLKDGMEQYNDEAISKLTDNSKISTIEDLADLFNTIQEDGDSYNNYSGISTGTEGSVKFIYKVNGVESTSTSSKTTTTDTEEDSKDDETFLDRLVGLFDVSSLFSKD